MEPQLRQNHPVYQSGAGTIAPEQQRVLRNTYLLLALTMVPTVAGAFIGIATGGIIMQHPFISFFVMLGACIGPLFAIGANPTSPLGEVLLLLMPGGLWWFLGPLIAVALTLKDGPRLIGMAAIGTGAIFAVMVGAA